MFEECMVEQSKGKKDLHMNRMPSNECEHCAGTKRFFSNTSKDEVVDVGSSRFKFLPEPSDD